MRRGIAQGLVFAVGGFLWAGKHFSPKAPEPIAHVRFDPTEVEKSVRFLEARVPLDPQGATGLAMLASAYLRRQSEQGDPDDLLRAEAAARRSLRIRSYNNPMGLWACAKSLMGQHRFQEALPLAQRLGDGVLEAECWMERGDYPRAQQCLGKAASQQPANMALRALQARLAELFGNTRRAEDAYRHALVLAEANFETPAPSLAWFHSRLGVFLAAQGKSGAAQTELEAALAAYPDDRRTRLALAQLLACTGNSEEASRLAHQVALPEAAMLLYTLGESAQWERIVSEGSGLHVHGRSLALFLADHDRNPEQAVALMRAEWKGRHDLDTADALAWALLKAGKPAEAAQYCAKALATGRREASFHWHAGRIAEALGQRSEARTHYTTALQINPQFHVLGAVDVRTRLENLK